MYNYYAKTKRQYRFLIKRLNKLLANGSWEQLTEGQQEKYKTRLQSLYKKLQGAFSRPSLVKAMGAAVLVLGLSLPGLAQPFKAPVDNPFSLSNKGSVGIPTFVDIDGDGDLDLFDLDINPYAYAIDINYKENTGSATAATFGSASINPFGITTDSVTFKGTFGDLDGDGDYDMLRTSYYGNHLYYENTGSATMPAFATPTINPYGLSDLGVFSNSIFVDLDGDGDLDLMSVEYYGDFKYYQNTGTPGAPQFAPVVTNPLGLANTADVSFIDFADVDLDGDLDLMYLEYYGDFAYAENVGSNTAPQFGAVQSNPFSLSNVGSYPSFMTFADLDADGDADIFVIEYYGNYKYYENNSNIGIDENELSSALEVFPNPATDRVTINLDRELGSASLQVLTTTGQRVKSLEVTSTLHIPLDVKDLQSGIYLIKLTTQEHSGIIKLTVD